MDKSLMDLYQQGVITYETAMAHAVTPEFIKQSAVVTPKRVMPQR
jgi:Tfp pilus assembly ATPase PilU